MRFGRLSLHILRNHAGTLRMSSTRTKSPAHACARHRHPSDDVCLPACDASRNCAPFPEWPRGVVEMVPTATRASEQRHRPRPPTTRCAKSAQSLHTGLRAWPKLRRCRCHHGTCRKNFSVRALYRCRGTSILAAPWQQQPVLAGARNSSTTCFACSVGPFLRRIEAVRRN